MNILFLATLIFASGEPVADTAVDFPVVTPGPSVTLAEVLEAVDGRNLTLAVARMEIEKAQAQLELSWARLFPVVGAQATYARNDHADRFNLSDTLAAALPPAIAPPASASEPLVVRRRDEARGALVATLPLVSPQAWVGVSAAQIGVEVAELTVENARQQLLFASAQAFWIAHINLELVGIQQSQLKAAAHHLEVARARAAAGAAMRIDVVRAETQVEKARQDLLAAHLGLDNARDALATLMASKDLPIPVAPPELEAPTPRASGEVADLLTRRPDVRAAQAMVRLADRMVDVSWMQFLPTLGLSGRWMYLFTDPPDLGSSDTSRWAAILTLSVPIYNQVRYADLDAKRVARAQASRRQADLLANVELEVRKANRNYLSALSSQETANRQASLSREALALTEAAYENGASTSLDVTDAQRTNQMAEINAATSRLRSQMALLSLMRALGNDPHSLVSAGG